MSGGNGQGRDDAFYALVLSGLGAPINQVNLGVLRAWQKAEGGSASWNPFNTTKTAPGATAYNSNNGHPVRNYTSESQGVAATVATLKLGYYKAIVAALKASNAPAAIAAIVASPWDGHYGAKSVSGGGYDYTKSSIYSAWRSTGGNAAGHGTTATLPSDLKSGTGSGGTAKYDPISGALIGPDGTIWYPYSLWLKQVPAATRATIKITIVPGAYATIAKTKDPGGVTDVGVQAVDATAQAVTDALNPFGTAFGWLNDNKGRIGLGLLGVLLLIFGVVYTQKGTIKETAGTLASVAKVAAVA
jgi:hypothetical protein